MAIEPPILYDPPSKASASAGYYYPSARHGQHQQQQRSSGLSPQEMLQGPVTAMNGGGGSGIPTPSSSAPPSPKKAAAAPSSGGNGAPNLGSSFNEYGLGSSGSRGGGARTLVEFHKHPDSYLILPHHSVAVGGVQPMSRRTRKLVAWARYVQMLLRWLEMFGASGLFVCVICLRRMEESLGWTLRIPVRTFSFPLFLFPLTFLPLTFLPNFTGKVKAAKLLTGKKNVSGMQKKIKPIIGILHCVYAIYHLARSPTGRTPASTASYMLFALAADSVFLPFHVFVALTSRTQWQRPREQLEWRSVFATGESAADRAANAKLVLALFLLGVANGALHLLSLLLSLYLAIVFRAIARLPPDMNPLEDNLTSRHKRAKPSAADAASASSLTLTAAAAAAVVTPNGEKRGSQATTVVVSTGVCDKSWPPAPGVGGGDGGDYDDITVTNTTNNTPTKRGSQACDPLLATPPRAMPVTHTARTGSVVDQLGAAAAAAAAAAAPPYDTNGGSPRVHHHNGINGHSNSNGNGNENGHAHMPNQQRQDRSSKRWSTRTADLARGSANGASLPSLRRSVHYDSPGATPPKRNSLLNDNWYTYLQHEQPSSNENVARARSAANSIKKGRGGGGGQYEMLAGHDDHEEYHDAEQDRQQHQQQQHHGSYGVDGNDILEHRAHAGTYNDSDDDDDNLSYVDGDDESFQDHASHYEQQSEPNGFSVNGGGGGRRNNDDHLHQHGTVRVHRRAANGSRRSPLPHPLEANPPTPPPKPRSSVRRVHNSGSSGHSAIHHQEHHHHHHHLGANGANGASPAAAGPGTGAGAAKTSATLLAAAESAHPPPSPPISFRAKLYGDLKPATPPVMIGGGGSPSTKSVRGSTKKAPPGGGGGGGEDGDGGNVGGGGGERAVSNSGVDFHYFQNHGFGNGNIIPSSSNGDGGGGGGSGGGNRGYFLSKRRDVSGKVAEEGRGGGGGL
jgi:F0F1-type ATP synthase assembly protein I